MGTAVSFSGCGLFPSLDGLSPTDAGNLVDVSSDTTSGLDAADASDGASCAMCTGLVSAYEFANAADIGLDAFGHNSMILNNGTPTQSTMTPPGFGGHSLSVDGQSSLCIQSNYTFDTSADHTLCWWAQPTVLADQADMFVQTCSYDTWTTNSGTAYQWRINNCYSGTADLVVPSAFALNQWVQICQTYVRATLLRTVVINGQTGSKVSVTDSAPINQSPSSWCIGSYGGGGFWTGFIYEPMWFSRVLSDAEIEQVYAHGCCLP